MRAIMIKSFWIVMFPAISKTARCYETHPKISSRLWKEENCFSETKTKLERQREVPFHRTWFHIQYCWCSDNWPPAKIRKRSSVQFYQHECQQLDSVLKEQEGKKQSDQYWFWLGPTGPPLFTLARPCRSHHFHMQHQSRADQRLDAATICDVSSLSFFPPTCYEAFNKMVTWLFCISAPRQPGKM